MTKKNQIKFQSFLIKKQKNNERENQNFKERFTEKAYYKIREIDCFHLTLKASIHATLNTIDKEINIILASIINLNYLNMQETYIFWKYKIHLYDL